MPVESGLHIHTHTHTHTHTLSSTPLDEGSGCSRYFYLTTNNIYKRQNPMSPAGFESAVPTSALQTYASDHAAVGLAKLIVIVNTEKTRARIEVFVFYFKLPYRV